MLNNEQRALRRCKICNEPAVEERLLCQKHKIKYDAEKKERHLLKRMLNQKCYICGGDLRKFNSNGRCVNCSRKLRTSSIDIKKKFWSYINIKDKDDCWEWQKSTNSRGYGIICIGNKKRESSHRYAYRITHGEIPEGLLVLHHCDNKKCCNPKHLYIGTYKDNSNDAIGRDRQAKGESHGNHKLTENQVSEIRTSLLDCNELSLKYKVTKGVIYRIKNYKSWKHVK